MKRMLQFTLLALVLAASTTALARHHGEGGPGAGRDDFGMAPMMGHMQRMLEQLELDEQQQAAVKAIMDANRDSIAAHQATAHGNRARLHSLLTAPGLDQDALAALAEDEGQLATERVMMFGQTASQVLGVLNEEQRASLRAMSKDMPAQMRKRARAHRGGGQGTASEADDARAN